MANPRPTLYPVLGDLLVAYGCLLDMELVGSLTFYRRLSISL
ncbi:MAG: hypothetical protein ACKO24_03025 [Leptolyngbyaceae cyanobacterium]